MGAGLARPRQIALSDVTRRTPIGRYGVGRGSGTERELHLPRSNDVPARQRRMASVRDVVVEYLDFVADVAQERHESCWVEKAQDVVLV